MAFAALGQGDKAVELFELINPINHTATRAGVLRYKVEPYVAAADVYSMPPHVGRGGWTWYTGSAGWLQRAGIESILGLSVEGECCDPPLRAVGVAGFAMTLRYRGAIYRSRSPIRTARPRRAVRRSRRRCHAPVLTARPPSTPRGRRAHAIAITLGQPPISPII
jgi:cellobiose phosphorylase